MNTQTTRFELILLRHGQQQSALLSPDATVLNDNDDGLTQDGLTSIKKIAERLSRHVFPETITVSPLKRARETADCLTAKFPQAQFVFDDRLEERRFGFEPSVTVRQSQQLQMQAFAYPNQNVSGGESVNEHRARCVSWLDSRLNAWDKSDANKTEIAVCHGGTIEHLLFHILRIPTQNMAQVYCDLKCGNYHQLFLEKDPDSSFLTWRIAGLCMTGG